MVDGSGVPPSGRGRTHSIQERSVQETDTPSVGQNAPGSKISDAAWGRTVTPSPPPLGREVQAKTMRPPDSARDCTGAQCQWLGSNTDGLADASSSLPRYQAFTRFQSLDRSIQSDSESTDNSLARSSWSDTDSEVESPIAVSPLGFSLGGIAAPAPTFEDLVEAFGELQSSDLPPSFEEGGVGEAVESTADVVLFQNLTRDIALYGLGQSPEQTLEQLDDMLTRDPSLIDRVSIYGSSAPAMALAVQQDSAPLANLFLSHGASVSSEYQGKSLLNQATASQKHEMLSWLLQHDQNNHSEVFTPTQRADALVVALETADTESVTLLISAGAASGPGIDQLPRMVKKELVTAVLAMQKPEILAAFLRLERDSGTPLMNSSIKTLLLGFAVKGNNIPMAKFLVQQGTSTTFQLENSVFSPHAYALFHHNQALYEALGPEMGWGIPAKEAVDLLTLQRYFDVEFVPESPGGQSVFGRELSSHFGSFIQQQDQSTGLNRREARQILRDFSFVLQPTEKDPQTLDAAKALMDEGGVVRVAGNLPGHYVGVLLHNTGDEEINGMTFVDRGDRFWGTESKTKTYGVDSLETALAVIDNMSTQDNSDILRSLEVHSQVDTNPDPDSVFDALADTPMKPFDTGICSFANQKTELRYIMYHHLGSERAEPLYKDFSSFIRQQTAAQVLGPPAKMGPQPYSYDTVRAAFPNQSASDVALLTDKINSSLTKRA